MNVACAPTRLPFAPKPYPNELFSSWMLRIADANCVSLQELMAGFESCHPNVAFPKSLDWGFSNEFLKAVSRFCRAPVGILRSLDLRTRLPNAQPVLLLRLRETSKECRRCRKDRTGYAFCPLCITQQRFVHVRWEWVFPPLLYCRIHKSPLTHGCPTCGEDDPLPFGFSADPSIHCWRCRADLTRRAFDSRARLAGSADKFVEKVYHAALRRKPADCALLGDITASQFRCFVDDIFQLLAWYPSPELSPQSTDPRNLYFNFRKDILAIVAAFIPKALQTRNSLEQVSRLTRGIRSGFRFWRWSLDRRQNGSKPPVHVGHSLSVSILTRRSIDPPSDDHGLPPSAAPFFVRD